MLSKNTGKLISVPSEIGIKSAIQRVRPSPWQIVALVSLLAGLGSAGRAMVLQTRGPSPVTAAVTMLLATFVGWYVWGFFTYLADRVLFGGHADYEGTLRAFGRAYAFQGLFVFTFSASIGWLWGWVAFYVTLAAWGIVGPRHLGTRTWQAMVAGTLGMLLWLVCLSILTLTLSWNGMYVGVGAFLA